jgi:hypothetical protein
VGDPTVEPAIVVMDDLRSRLADSTQLATDEHRAYIEAVEGCVRWRRGLRDARLYGIDPEADNRYSPAKCLGAEFHRISGAPELSEVSTSHVERQNPTTRMGMRRSTRLTNAFSRQGREPRRCRVPSTSCTPNFAQPHRSLAKPYATTPAMAAGVSDHVWKIEEIVALLNR